jgi:hypothetical protein
LKEEGREGKDSERKRRTGSSGNLQNREGSHQSSSPRKKQNRSGSAGSSGSADTVERPASPSQERNQRDRTSSVSLSSAFGQPQPPAPIGNQAADQGEIGVDSATTTKSNMATTTNPAATTNMASSTDDSQSQNLSQSAPVTDSEAPILDPEDGIVNTSINQNRVSSGSFEGGSNPNGEDAHDGDHDVNISATLDGIESSVVMSSADGSLMLSPTDPPELAGMETEENQVNINDAKQLNANLNENATNKTGHSLTFSGITPISEGNSNTHVMDQSAVKTASSELSSSAKKARKSDPLILSVHENPLLVEQDFGVRRKLLLDSSIKSDQMTN